MKEKERKLKYYRQQPTTNKGMLIILFRDSGPYSSIRHLEFDFQIIYFP